MLKLLVPLAVMLAMPGGPAGPQTMPAETPAPRPMLHAQPAAPATPEAAAPAQPADPLAAAPRISPADAKKALDSGKAVLVDVRAADAWREEHAKGAINIPSMELYARLGELPKDKQVIAYCT